MTAEERKEKWLKLQVALEVQKIEVLSAAYEYGHDPKNRSSVSRLRGASLRYRELCDQREALYNQKIEEPP
jgi:hypothetical protein